MNKTRLFTIATVAPIAAMALVGVPADAAGSTRSGYAVDGDTVKLSSGTSVRVIGVDTPERGQCGYDAAKVFTQRFVSGGFTLKNSPTTDNTDRYDRILRYVKNRKGQDLGTQLIKKGLAVARYDGTDGYDWHSKQRKYHRLDRKHANKCAGDSKKPKTDKPNTSKYYKNCDAARAAGAAPVHRGDPGYGRHLDRDGDGVGCE